MTGSLDVGGLSSVTGRQPPNIFRNGIDRSELKEARATDQPTAEMAMKKLEPLVGEWTLEAIPPGGEPRPGGGQAMIEWHESGAHVVQRSTVEIPEAPQRNIDHGMRRGTRDLISSTQRCLTDDAPWGQGSLSVRANGKEDQDGKDRGD